MRHSRILSSVALIATLPLSAQAEGLERFNINPSFLFNEGSTANISFASVSPSLEATEGVLFDLETGLDVGTSFSAVTGSVKTSVGENIDLGIWYSNSGNGVAIDYGTIAGATSLGSNVDFTIEADLKMPTLAALGRYKVTDNISVFGGIKRVTVNDGANLKLGSNLVSAGGVIDEQSHWILSETSEMGMIYGAAYEMPDIAFRVSLMIEDDIDLTIATTVGAGVAPAAGNSTASIGDAMTLDFQSGIAEDTLLFGSIRNSKWKDNQVSVPTAAGSAQVSDFDDGTSYSLGVGRKISDDLSLSISAFYDGGDGNDASELSPTGSNRSISFGGKYAIAENADLSGGINYSMRGDATTSNLGATLNDSTVMTIGASVAFKF